MFGIKAIGMLRISEEGELEGLDIHEHGAPAYHPEPSYDGLLADPEHQDRGKGIRARGRRPEGVTHRLTGAPPASARGRGRAPRPRRVHPR